MKKYKINKRNQELKVGDKVRDIYNNFEGIVIDVWDGKYTVDYYTGEQFNPYRITVRFGQDYIEKYGGGILGDGTVTKKTEALKKILATQ